LPIAAINRVNISSAIVYVVRYEGQGIQIIVSITKITLISIVEFAAISEDFSASKIGNP